MPTFDYTCGSCGKTTEVYHRSAKDRPPACPSCGSPAMVRQLCAPRAHVGRDAHCEGTCCGRDEPCETPACRAGTCPR